MSTEQSLPVHPDLHEQYPVELLHPLMVLLTSQEQGVEQLSPYMLGGHSFVFFFYKIIYFIIHIYLYIYIYS